jgi:hypothetical protein
MTKLLAYKWTCVCGLAFLGSFLGSVVSSNGVNDILVLVCSLAFIVSVITSVVKVVTRRSSGCLYRLLLNVAFAFFSFPLMSGYATQSDVGKIAEGNAT